MKISLTNLQKPLIAALVALMPFHTLLFHLIPLGDGLRLWRDVLLFGLVGLNLVRAGRQAVTTTTILIALAWVAGGFHALMFHDRGMDIGVWGNVYRVYFMPFLAAGLMLCCPEDYVFRRMLCRIYVWSAVAVSAFGIVQMFLIGNAYLNLIGVGWGSVRLADGFQRNIGVFESANVMGIYVVFALILTMYDPKLIRRKAPIVLFLAISLLLTFSVSSLLAILLAVAYKEFIVDKGARFAGRGLKSAGIAAAGIALFLLIDRIVLRGTIAQRVMERVVEILTAITQYDPESKSSAAIHLRSLIEPIGVLAGKPWGIGFATNTFMTWDKVGYQLTGAVESSVFTILYDLGILAGILYLLPYLKAAFGTRGGRGGISSLMAVALLVSFVFLPLVQNYELRFFLFLFVGMNMAQPSAAQPTASDSPRA